MKSFYLLCLLIGFNSYNLLSQTGTIKVIKPKSDMLNMDTINPRRSKYLNLSIEAETNYSFKKNNKIGYNFEVPYHRDLFIAAFRMDYSIGIKYSFENQYHDISPYNKALSQIEPDSGRSQNKLSYLGIPIKLTPYRFDLGPTSQVNFSAAVPYNKDERTNKAGSEGDKLYENKPAGKSGRKITPKQ